MSSPGNLLRVWRAVASSAGLARYLTHFEQAVMPELRATAGFLQAGILARDAAEGGIELVVTTGWKSLESVRAFAGEDPDRAVVHPDARAALLGCDERVLHYHWIRAFHR